MSVRVADDLLGPLFSHRAAANLSIPEVGDVRTVIQGGWVETCFV